MAHEKLSPRQKMIGMMYLVLTAMLALNVSKETVKAFIRVDKGLALTVQNYNKKNSLIYSEFDRAAAENPVKAGPYKSKAAEVKLRADEIFEYIQNLKILIIKTADGEDAVAIKGSEIDMDLVEKFDENNIPSQILVGSKESGKGYELKAMLNEYRDFLISTLEGKNPDGEESLKKSLNTDNGKNEDGDTEQWVNLQFQLLPLVGATTLLTKMQVDVRNAETEVLNYLYSKIDASSFKFTKLDAIVTANSNYVTLGSDYEARVFISATDSTQFPVITVGSTVLDNDDFGKGIYKVKATSIGLKKWGGIIAIKAPDGTILNKSFESSYNVGEPNVVVSPTGMNVFYTGIENPLDVSVPGVGPDQIKVSITNGDITKGRVKNPQGEFFRGSYIVKPKAAGQKVLISVTADINGKPMKFDPIEYRVKPLPIPVPVIAGRSGGSIPINTIKSAVGVFATLPDFDFQLVYNITGFTVILNDRGEDFEKRSTGSNFTPDQKQIFNRLTRGKNLYISAITAVGPDGATKDLPPMIFKIE
jgi:gliding motility-associated protein GldM